MTTTDSITTSPHAPKPPKRHRVRNTVLVVSAVTIAGIIGANAAGGGSKPATSTSSPPVASAPANPTPNADNNAPLPPGYDGTGGGGPAQVAPAAPAPTVAQQQALTSAQNYLSSGMGFSKAGLLDQLTSSAGEGFTVADARWAIRHAHPDWNAQAVQSAKNYMSSGMGFSRSELIDQLTSSAGEGFTLAQATYAADQVGL